MDVKNICFLGQTGFGKSSLINALFKSSFNTDPLVACTKELYSVTVIDGPNNRLVTVYDTPGIGEFSNNSAYQMFYNYAASIADHIVLVVTLDRVDSTSQELLESLYPYLKSEEVKFTIALNRIDSTGVMGENKLYKAWDIDNDKPTNECLIKVRDRITTIKQNFGCDIDFLPFNIFPVCALRNYGLDDLREHLLQL